MSLSPLVAELHSLFPYVDEETIKSLLIDCNYDRNATADLLLIAQENGNFEYPTDINIKSTHHKDVAFIYKDSVVTLNKDQIIPQTQPQKPKPNTLNEEYKRSAEEDERLKESGIPTIHITETEEKAYKKKGHTHKKRKSKGQYSLLDSGPK
ncbi:CUE domain-containing protein [Entamoeba marina]